MLPHQARNKAELITATREHPAKYVFFWGHTPPADGAVNKSCFSQWYGTPFVINGIVYPTAEHFMMAEKARLFANTKIEAQILAARTPGEAKALGRKVKNFDQAIWEAQCFAIVIAANLAKFSQHAALGDFLRATGQRVLVEASPQDLIWGIGLSARDPGVDNPAQWPGENRLGFALMEVREQLLSA